MNTYHIGAIEFDPDACELHQGEHLQHLQPQVRSVLLCLVKHQGEVVHKDDLIDEAWKGRPASEECLTRCISKLRKHLSAEGNRQSIDTIPRVGYRLRCDDSLPCFSQNCASHAHTTLAVSEPEAPAHRVRAQLLAHALTFLTGAACATGVILLLISL
jgi:DNA-binding winged helix-turn-helix (wHTH) protein